MPLYEDKDDDDSNVLTMMIIPPDELHLLLGLNHMFQELKKVWPDADKWASSCHVYVQGQFQQFNGNGCYTLVQSKSLDKLESNIPIPLFNFALALRALSTVVSSCFGYTVAPSTEEDIKRFKKLYLDLNITVTPKVGSLVKTVIIGYCDKLLIVTV